MADITRSTAGSAGAGQPSGTGSQQNGQQSENRDAGQALVSDARNMGNELLSAVRDSATSLFDDQRNRAADQIASAGNTLRRSVEALEQDSNLKFVARYADDAAQQIVGFAEGLRNRSWSELSGDIEDFARRWPIAFMASAIGVGFVAGRFVAAAAPRSSSSSTTASEPPRIAASGHDAEAGARHQSGAASGGSVSSGSTSGSSMSPGATSGHGGGASREQH